MPRASTSTSQQQHQEQQETGKTPRIRSRPHKRKRPAAAPPAAAPPSATLHPSQFTSYNPTTSSWEALTPSRFAWPSPAAITLLTYNTWTSSPSHSPLQSLALLEILQQANADILALQEITLPFYTSLLAQPWLREGYCLPASLEFWWSVTESPAAGGGQQKVKGGKKGAREACVLLVRKELVGKGSWSALRVLERARGEGGKGWVEVGLTDGGGRERLRIATSHFSSLPHNAPLRQRQYTTVLSSLFLPSSSSSPSASPSPTRILLADLNHSTPSELSLLTNGPYSLQDAHPSPAAAAAGGGDRPTFGHLYPFIPGAPRSKPRKQRRVDRVYFSPSSSEAEVECTEYEHLGEEPLRHPRSGGGRQGKVVKDREAQGGWMRASDHAAVWVKLEGV